MEMFDISRLEVLARDYTETCRRVLFVLGECDEVAMQVFLDMQNNSMIKIEYGLVPENTAKSRRSICISTPAQMIPEIVRELVRANVAVYQIVAI